MIVSVCLSKGALAMSRKKVIVKRLNAIQNFGGMDVLCTDKTGTLTEDRVVLHAALQRRRAGNRGSAPGRLPDQPLPDGPQEPARPGDPGQPRLPRASAGREVQEAGRDPFRLHAAHDVRPGGGSRRQSDPPHQGSSGRGLPPVLALRAGREAVADGPRPDGRAEGRVREPQQRWLPGAGGGNQGAAGEADLLEGRRARPRAQRVRRVSGPAQEHCGTRASRPFTSTAWR